MKGHYYVFLKEEQRRPGKCFITLSWGGGTENGLFQGFPRALLGLELAGSLHRPLLYLLKSRASLLIPREKGKQDNFFIIRENIIILSVTNFIIHCKKHGPQQRKQEYNNKHYEQGFPPITLKPGFNLLPKRRGGILHRKYLMLKIIYSIRHIGR